MGVSVENRVWHRARKAALLIAAGVFGLALITGLFAYESIKGRGVAMTRGIEAAAAERMVAPPPIDASRPQRTETATFALG
jgi:hypothetical protein